MKINGSEPTKTSVNFLFLSDPKLPLWTDVLTCFAEELENYGFVQHSYIRAVLEREEEYPTGLKLDCDINISIPHAAHFHVKQDVIAFAILRPPVLFREMHEPENRIPVSIVFMLAAKTPLSLNDYLYKLFNNVLKKTDVMQWLVSLEDPSLAKPFFNKTLVP
jgi:galactitol PTS system EIIA component